MADQQQGFATYSFPEPSGSGATPDVTSTQRRDQAATNEAAPASPAVALPIANGNQQSIDQVLPEFPPNRRNSDPALGNSPRDYIVNLPAHTPALLSLQPQAPPLDTTPVTNGEASGSGSTATTSPGSSGLQGPAQLPSPPAALPPAVAPGYPHPSVSRELLPVPVFSGDGSEPVNNFRKSLLSYATYLQDLEGVELGPEHLAYHLRERALLWYRTQQAWSLESVLRRLAGAFSSPGGPESRKSWPTVSEAHLRALRQARHTVTVYAEEWRRRAAFANAHARRIGVPQVDLNSQHFRLWFVYGLNRELHEAVLPHNMAGGGFDGLVRIVQDIEADHAKEQRARRLAEGDERTRARCARLRQENEQLGAQCARLTSENEELRNRCALLSLSGNSQDASSSQPDSAADVAIANTPPETEMQATDPSSPTLEPSDVEVRPGDDSVSLGARQASQDGRSRLGRSGLTLLSKNAQQPRNTTV